jgi:hypothetical protein
MSEICCVVGSFILLKALIYIYIYIYIKAFKRTKEPTTQKISDINIYFSKWIYVSTCEPKTFFALFGGLHCQENWGCGELDDFSKMLLSAHI